LIGVCKSLAKNTINFNLIDQVVRSGTSLGANYREANETETKKDFLYRIRICRKESKETIYWLKLLIEANTTLTKDLTDLLSETQELLKIFSAIHENSK